MNPASDYSQRWRDGRHSWRHRSEGGFDSSRYEVALLDQDSDAKRFVEVNHYAHSYPAARLRVGLYERTELVGVAVFGVPMQAAVLTNAFPHLEPYTESLELSRFVLLDEVPHNAESWMLAKAFNLVAHQGLRGVVAFADPMPRLTASGELVMPGHIGAIYQASNGLHTAGRSTPRTLLLGPDGRVLSARTLSKIRRAECGHEYAERQLVDWGAAPRPPGQPAAEWLPGALAAARVTKVRHPGNYRYLFRVGRTRAERSRVVIGMVGAAYPKAAAA